MTELKEIVLGVLDVITHPFVFPGVVIMLYIISQTIYQQMKGQ